MQDATAPNFDTPQRLIELEHGEVAYWQWGTGPDLVFVHGWPLHGATWRRVIGAFSEHFTCHVFDLPGAGHTRWAEGAPFGLWEHARTLEAALREIGVDRFGLVAHDSGGTIARLLATITAGEVTALVLGNTEVPGHTLQALRWAKIGVELPGAARVVRAMMSSQWLVRESFRGCFADLAQLETDFSELFVAPLQRDTALVQRQFRLVQHIDWNVVTEELAGVHREIKAPVILIWGDRDPWFPWEVAKEMVDSFGGEPADVHLIAGGKLFAHEEFGDEFASVAVEFLLRRSRGSS